MESNERPCPKCGQTIPIGVTVCYHCQQHFGFWGWLNNISIIASVLAAFISVFSAFLANSDKQAAETALRQSKEALKEIQSIKKEIKSENALRVKSDVEQRWDIFRSRHAARVNGCRQLNPTYCDFLIGQEVQDFYFFVKVLYPNFEVFSNPERAKYCGSASATIASSSKNSVGQQALQIFPSLKAEIEKICTPISEQ